jgi:hypothetical protein
MGMVRLEIPIIPVILWLEINYLGKSILPELIVLLYTILYIVLNFLWRKKYEKFLFNHSNYLI